VPKNIQTGLIKVLCSIDFAFQIFADPLTYLTAGASNLGKANKLTKALISSRDAVEYFANTCRCSLLCRFW